MRDLVYFTRFEDLEDGRWRLHVEGPTSASYGPFSAAEDRGMTEHRTFQRWKAKARSRGGDAHIRERGVWVVLLPD